MTNETISSQKLSEDELESLAEKVHVTIKKNRAFFKNNNYNAARIATKDQFKKHLTRAMDEEYVEQPMLLLNPLFTLGLITKIETKSPLRPTIKIEHLQLNFDKAHEMLSPNWKFQKPSEQIIIITDNLQNIAIEIKRRFTMQASEKRIANCIEQAIEKKLIKDKNNKDIIKCLSSQWILINAPSGYILNFDLLYSLLNSTEMENEKIGEQNRKNLFLGEWIAGVSDSPLKRKRTGNEKEEKEDPNSKRQKMPSPF